MQLKPPSLRTATIAQEGTSMQRKRRMLTASRLCLLGIAGLAPSLSLSAQCPQDATCRARVELLTAITNGQNAYAAVLGENQGGVGVMGINNQGIAEGVYGYGNNGVHGNSVSVRDSGVWGDNQGGGYGVSGSTTSYLALGQYGAGVWGANFGD